MKQHSKLSSDEKQQHASAERQAQQAGKDFATVEELLRFDAAQTSVPGTIEQRLTVSAAEIPSPARPWWKKLFGC